MNSRLHPMLMPEQQKLNELEGIREKVIGLLHKELGAELDEKHDLYIVMVVPYEEAITAQKRVLERIRVSLLPLVGRHARIIGGRHKSRDRHKIVWLQNESAMVTCPQGKMKRTNLRWLEVDP